MSEGFFGGLRPKIIVAIQDEFGRTTVLTGIVQDGSLRIDYDHEELIAGLYTTHIPTGRKTATLDVIFDVQDYGAQMKTWADIKKPEEINAAQPAIETDRTV
jgi:hypothetical protein